MNRLFFVLTAVALLCLGSLPVRAQVEGNDILDINVEGFTFTVKQEPVRSTAGEIVETVLDALADKITKEEPGYADAVRATIVLALRDVRRFRINDAPVEPGGWDGYLIDGTINYISITSEIRDRGRSGDRPPRRIPDHYAQVGVTINVKDPAGTLLDSQMFEVNKNSWSWQRTPETAMQKALDKLRTNITKHYNATFPYTANILEHNGDKSKLYIDLGSAHGLQKGIRFTVYALGEIGGKETRTEIGRLKVTRIEGDEVSQCKAVSGSQEIRAALENGTRLMIVSID